MEKSQNFYMDRDSFIAYIKTEEIYIHKAKDIESNFDA